MMPPSEENISSGLVKRLEILETALNIERLTSIFLATLLGIKDYSNSYTLGNKGGGFSFNQKIDLLIEIGALAKSDKNKFQTFMEIRNIFMHNISADTYENCFSLLSKGKVKFLLETYPESNGTREEQFRNISNILCAEITILTVEIIYVIKEKAIKSAREEFMTESNYAFIEAIGQIRTSIDEYFQIEIAKGTHFNVKRLNGFGTALSKIIFARWKNIMKNK